MSETESLWQNRSFTIYWAGQTLSALGDAFAFVAMPLLVLDATGSVAQMGMVTATFGIGMIASGPFAGALVDRVDRRRLMIACDLVRALTYAAIPIAWTFFRPSLGLIYAVTLLGSIFGNLFGVAYITATVNLVDKHHLVAANGRLQGSHGVTFVFGPMLAGLLTARFGAAMAIGFDALSFVASAVSLMMISLRQERALRAHDEAPFDELLAGLRYLLREPVLRAVALFFIVFAMITTGVVDLMIFEVKNGMGGDDTTVGVVMGVSAVGAAIGGLTAFRFRSRFGFGACFLGAGFVQAAALLVMGLAPSLTALAAMGVIYSGGMVLRGVITMSLRQQITPDPLLGRVTAAFWTISGLLGPLGAAASTRIAEVAGARPVIAGTGVLVALIALWGLRTPVRQAHPEAGRA